MKTNSKITPTYILGISCFYHDSAAALIKDGKLIAAAHEERFTRKKHDDEFPKHAIDYCLEEAGVTVSDLSYVAFYDKPFTKFERILESFMDVWPRGYLHFLHAIPMWLKDKLFTKQRIAQALGYDGPIYFAEHHMSHAASAFFVSPFTDAAILTVDGVGEWTTTSWGVGHENKIDLREEIRYPHSWGLFYSIITHFLGFKTNSAEYKVMGLAPYGEPKYVTQLKKLVTIHDDGSFAIKRSLVNRYFDMCSMEGPLAKVFGFPRRDPESELEQCHKDLAASIQALTNEVMVKLAKHVQEKTGKRNLCMAGGVALNCVANYATLKEAGFENIYIQPAAGDAGGALGVAYWVWHQVLNKPRGFEMTHCAWGPSYSDKEIEEALSEKELLFTKASRAELLEKTAEMIVDQHIVGWFQGRMEWGPRALGNRSILADARSKENWQRVNLKIKFRENFRPFAPSVLAERAHEYFDFPGQSPHMLFVAPVKREDVPAITHVDGTARLQTVARESNQIYHELISVFADKTGCPLIINTSFNVRGEPIVCTPQDAIRVFLTTDMDYLVIGSYIVDKAQCESIVQTYREETGEYGANTIDPD